MILLKLTNGWDGEPCYIAADKIVGFYGYIVHRQGEKQPDDTRPVDKQPGTRIDVLGGPVGGDGDNDCNAFLARETPDQVEAMLSGLHANGPRPVDLRNPEDPSSEAAGPADMLAVLLKHAGQVWRHFRRGTAYTIISPAILQANSPLSDGHAMLVYRDADGLTWVRSIDEFFDGRFQQVPRGDTLADEPAKP